MLPQLGSQRAATLFASLRPYIINLSLDYLIGHALAGIQTANPYRCKYQSGDAPLTKKSISLVMPKLKKVVCTLQDTT